MAQEGGQGPPQQPTITPFPFDGGEVRTIYRRVKLAMLCGFPYDYRNDKALQKKNERTLQRMMRAIMLGSADENMPQELLEHIFQAAWAAYHNAIILERTDGEARRSAVMYAQLPLEQHVFGSLGETGDAGSNT